MTAIVNPATCTVKALRAEARRLAIRNRSLMTDDRLRREVAWAQTYEARQTKEAARVEKFDRLLNLEQEVRSARAAIECRMAGVPLFAMQRQHEARQAAQARLFGAIDDLAPEEAEAFSAYRRAKAYAA